jgi:hypothetical protein
MKYDKEITQKLIADYESGKTVAEISAMMTLSHGEPVPDRSIIAKLSSLGVYRKKEYLTKRGEVPIKKEEYIERIAKLLDVNAEILESLEKVNKSVLALIEKRLTVDPVQERAQQLAGLNTVSTNYFTDPLLKY